MSDLSKQITLKLVIDGKEAHATLDVVKGEFVATGKTGEKANEQIKKSYQALVAEASKYNQVNKESVASLTKFISSQNVSVNVIEGTIKALEHEITVLAVNSKEWKEKTSAALNLKAALMNTMLQTTDQLGVTGKAQGDIIAGASKWGMIMTGVNQSVELVRNTFTGLKDIISDSVKTATGLEVLRDNFKGNAEDLELFRKASAGTVSEANLIKLSNQATDLGISLKDQAILFSLAEDAADKYGGGVEAGFQRIVYASEGNVRGLKDVGIQKEIYEKIVKELAEAHGGLIDKLDAETQKQIRLEAIIKASGLTVDDVKNKTKDNADKLEALSVRVEEAKVSFGNLVAKGLLPLIEAFDNSGKSSKDIVSAIIGVGGVAFQAIPILVNLRMAQALLGKQALITAGEMGVATEATNANTIAAGGWMSKVGIGLVAIVGAGIGLAAGKLIDYIKYDLPEQINKASEEAANKLKADKFEGALDRIFNKGQRFVPGEGTFIITPKISKLDEGEVKKIQDRIKELTDANDTLKHPNIGIKEYVKNLQEAARLQKILNPEVKTQTEIEGEASKIIDKKIANIIIELTIADKLNKAKLGLLQKSDEELSLILKGNLKEEDKLKVLSEQKKIHDEIKKINDDIIKGTYRSLPDAGGRGERIDLQKERIPALLEADKIVQQKRLEMIDDEFEKRKAEINDEANDLLNKYSEAEGKRLELEQEFAAARKAIEEAVIIELEGLEQQRRQKELEGVSEFGNALVGTFNIAGHTLVSKLNDALKIAVDIAKAINAYDKGDDSIWGIFSSIIPGLGFLKNLLGLEKGGPAHAGQMYEVNEKGKPELLQVDDKQFLMMGNRSGHVIPIEDNYTGGFQSAEMIQRAVGYASINAGSATTRKIEYLLQANLEAIQKWQSDLKFQFGIKGSDLKTAVDTTNSYYNKFEVR